MKSFFKTKTMKQSVQNKKHYLNWRLCGIFATTSKGQPGSFSWFTWVCKLEEQTKFFLILRHEELLNHLETTPVTQQPLRISNKVNFFQESINIRLNCKLPQLHSFCPHQSDWWYKYEKSHRIYSTLRKEFNLIIRNIEENWIPVINSSLLSIIFMLRWIAWNDNSVIVAGKVQELKEVVQDFITMQYLEDKSLKNNS